MDDGDAELGTYGLKKNYKADLPLPQPPLKPAAEAGGLGWEALPQGVQSALAALAVGLPAALLTYTAVGQ